MPKLTSHQNESSERRNDATREAVSFYGVEQLEPKILLSAAPIDAAPEAYGLSPLDAVDSSALEEVRFANVVEIEASAETFMPHDAEASLLGDGEDFSWGEESESDESDLSVLGEENQPLDAPEIAPADLANTASADDDQELFDTDLKVDLETETALDEEGNEDLVTTAEEVSEAVAQAATTTASLPTLTPWETILLTDPTPGESAAGDPTVAQLVTTLNAANGPPVAGNAASTLDSSLDHVNYQLQPTVEDGFFESALEGVESTDSADNRLIVSGDRDIDVGDIEVLTAEEANRILQEALLIWSESNLPANLASRLESISIRIIDLPEGVLGEANGFQIDLDSTAAGFGWFVDSTPSENGEFLSTDDLISNAASGSAAEGRVDLLTVLVHEIGHVLGQDHDSGLAVIAKTLGSGERVLLADDVGSLRGVESISAALISGSPLELTLDLSPAADNGSDVLVMVNVNGSVDILGSDGDDGIGIANILNIVGNSSGTVTLAGPDVATEWILDGANSGSLTIPGGPTITFSGIDALIGGSADDEFRVGSSYTLAVSIKGGGGNDRVVIESSSSADVAFDGEGGNADTVVNESGTSGITGFSNVETRIERPLLFIPGFAGSFANTALAEDPGLDGSTVLEEWYLNRGLSPTRLVLEPLSEGYSDIVQTLVNIGYVNGTNTGLVGTLFSALWDWRVPVAETDDTADGTLSNVTAASLLDTSFDSSLDYLAYWMDQAVTAWSMLTGGAPAAVDVLTHSTGGLVARSYIQSAAYDAVASLLPIHTLIQTGVPNQGTGAPFVLLNNDFSAKSAARLLGKTLNDVWDLKQSGATILNPDGSVFEAANEAEFVRNYVESLHDLLASYEFLDDVQNEMQLLRALTSSDDLSNALLADLNAYNTDAFVARGVLDVVEDDLLEELADADADVDSIVTFIELLALYDTDDNNSLDVVDDALPEALSAADDGNGLGLSADGIVTYEELLRLYDRQTFIVYSEGVDTDDLVIAHTGFDSSLGLANEVLPITEVLVGSLPESDEIWYELKNHPSGGDGTVSAFSASAGFAAARLVEMTVLAGENIEHTGITHNEISQRKIVELLGVTDETVALISTGLMLSKPQTAKRLYDIGLIDPVELARQAYDRAVAQLEILKQTVLNHSLLKTNLPLVNQNLGQLLNDAINGLDLNALFDDFASSVGSFASEPDLTALESAIESALGLSASEFSIVNDIDATGQLMLVFDILESSVYTTNIDLGASGGPLTGDPIVLNASLDLELSFSIVIDIGSVFSPSGEEDGTSGLEIVLSNFTVSASLNASDIGMPLDFAGLGGLTIENGTVNFDLGLDIGFEDTDESPDSLSVSKLLTLDGVSGLQSLMGFEVTDSSLTVNLPATVAITSDDLDLSGSGYLRISSSDVFNGESPDLYLHLDGASLRIGDSVFLTGNLDFRRGADLDLELTGSVTGNGPGGALLIAGPVTIVGSADFSMTRRITDVDSDGDGIADLINAQLDSLALSVTDASVSVNGVADMTVSGDLALAWVTPAGETGVRFTALKMGDVTVTSSTATAADFGLAGTLTDIALDYNGTTGAERLDWTRAFDLDADGTPDLLDLGANLVTPVQLLIDFDDNLELRLKGNVTGNPADNDIFLTAGPVSMAGTAAFALTRRIADVDIDGDGVVDEAGARLDTMALVVTDAVVEVSGLTTMTVSGELALARVLLTDGTVYSAFKMGNVSLRGPPVAAEDFGLTGLLTINGLDYNGSALGDRLDWTSAFDFDGDGNADVLNPGQDLPTPADLAIDFNAGLELRVSGSVTGNSGNSDIFLTAAPVTLAGIAEFSLTRQTVDVDVNGSVSTGAQLDSVALSVTGAILDVSGVAELTVSGELALARVTLTDARVFTALKMGDVVVSASGNLGNFGLGGTLTIGGLDYNSASTGDRLDWANAFDFDDDGEADVLNPGQDLPTPADLAIDFDSGLELRLTGSVSGAAILTAGPVTIGGTAEFTLTRQTLDVNANGSDLLGAQLDSLAISLTDATLEISGIASLTVSGQLALASVTAATESTARYTALKMGGLSVSASAADSALDFGLIESLTIETLNYNQAAIGFSRLDWTSAFDFDSNGTDDLLNPGAFLPTPLDLTIDFTSELVLLLSGEITVDLGGYVLAAGGFTLSKTFPTDVDLLADGMEEDVELLTISLTGVNLFVGVGAVFDTTTDPDHFTIDTTNATGFSVANADLHVAMARIADQPSDTRRWTGISASADNMVVVGLPSDFTLRVDNLSVLLNSATGATPLSWDSLIATGPLNGLSGSKAFEVSGDLTLNLSGYVMVAGGFSIEKTTPTDVDLGSNGILNIDLLTISLTDVNLFVGTGGVFDTSIDGDYSIKADSLSNPGNLVDIADADANATGFSVTDANLYLALASVTNPDPVNPPVDTRRWTGIAASADSMSVVGLPSDYLLHVDNLSVLVNLTSGAGADPINWSALVDAPNPLNGLAADTDFSVSGDLTLNLGGYVLVAGGFSVEKTSQTGVDLLDDAVLVNLDLLTISLTDVNLFVGTGGVFDTSVEGNYSINTDDATGFSVTNANLYLAIASVTNPTPENPPADTRRWTGIAASADDMTIAGLPSDFDLHVYNLNVLVNSASGVGADPINWSVLVDAPNPLNGLAADTDFSVSGDLTLNLGGYVMVAGGFSIEKTSQTGVDLGSNGILNIDLLTIELTDVNLFVGTGGVFDTTTDPENISIDTAEATGFSVTDADLFLTIVSVTDPTPDTPPTDTRRWTGIAASAGDMTVVGLPSDFDIHVRNLEVFYNEASGSDPVAGTVARIDWSAPLVATDSPLDGLLAATTLSVSGDITLNLGGYVLVAGGFHVVKTTPTGVDLGGNGASVDLDLLQVQLTGVNLFVGTGASFNTGTAGSYSVNTGGATGFSVTNANLYLAIASVTDPTPADPPTDTRRWTGIAASAGAMTVVGLPSALDLQLNNISVMFNQASGTDGAPVPVAATKIDWAPLVDGGNLLENLTSDTTFSAAGDAVLNLLDSTVVLTASVAIKVSTQDVYLRNTASPGDLVALPVNVNAFELGVYNATALISVGGQTASLGGVSLGLAYYSANDGSGRSWLGLKTVGGSVVAGGDVGAIGASDISVSLNQGFGTSNDTVVDFKRSFETASTLNDGAVLVDTNGPVEIRLDFEGEFLSMSAQLDLVIADFFYASGVFTYTDYGSRDVWLVDGVSPVSVSVRTLSVTNASVFVGTDGPYRNLDGSVNPNALGFELSGVDFTVVEMSAADGRQWTAVRAIATSAGLVGIEGFTLSASSLLVELNTGNAAAGETVVNFGDSRTSLPAEADEFSSYTGKILQVSGNAVLDINGFVQVSGGFAFTKESAVNVKLTGQTGLTLLNLTTFGFSHVNVFIGAGPYFVDSNGDGLKNEVSADAAGVLLKDANLAVALFKPATGAASYYAISASAESIELPGLFEGDSSTFSGHGYRIEVNSSNAAAAGKVVDFSTTYATDSGSLLVPTGPGENVSFGYASKLERVAIDQLTLSIDDYVYVSGGFSFTRQQGQTVTLSDKAGTKRVVDSYALAAGNVDLFVGDGPYFVEGAAPDPDAVGLVLENVNFGVILMRPTAAAHKATKYIALKATADYAGLVGIDVFKLSASGIDVEYNTVSGAPNPDTAPVVDFSKMPGGSYVFDTGNGELEINYKGRVLRVVIEDAELQIDSYVFIRGSLAFEKGAAMTVEMSSGAPKSVTSINVGAEDLTMFFGADGPYWTDLDGDGEISWAFDVGKGDALSRTLTHIDGVASGSLDVEIDGVVTSVTIGTASAILPENAVVSLGEDQIVTVGGVRYGDFINGDPSTVNLIDPGESGELNPDAVGFAITNADLALVLLKPTITSDKTRYIGMKASADQVGFVGIDVFQLEVTNVVVELNLATGGGADKNSPVVNFAATYQSELVALFDSTHDGITVGELRTLAGGGAASAYSSVIGELYGTGALSDDPIELADVVRILDVNADGLLSVTEAQTFLLNDALATTADDDHDGKIDPVGYEVATGGSPAYLSDSMRRIHASADNVLVNVAEFVYLNGSVSLDLGSRETVTISTGIPADLVSLAEETFSFDANVLIGELNAALASLSSLDDLKASVKLEIENAINAVKSEINGMVLGLVDTIFDNLSAAITSGIDSLKDSVATSVTDQLTSVTSSLSVDSLVDGIIDPITALVDDATLKGLVSELLSPIKKLLAKELESVIQDALAGAVDKIVGSVGDAVSKAVEGGLDKAEQSVKEAIFNAIDPQIARVVAKLNELIALLETKLSPIFTQLESIGGIVIGEDFSTISGLQVDVTAIGVGHATAFVGLPPADGLDFSIPIVDQNALGFFIDDFNMGLGIFKPVLSKQLPTFIAAKISADSAGFSDGEPGTDTIEMIAKEIQVKLNLGGPLVKGGGALLGAATIDFVKSFSELLVLFDVTDETGAAGQDGVITVGDLRELTGDDAGEGAFAGLYSADDDNLLPISAAAIFFALDASGSEDGLLQVSEAEAVLLDPTLAGDADGNSDLTLDVGFAVQTGTNTDPIFLDYEGGERIIASVGIATLKISEYVHITGSIAFEKGQIETVAVTGGLFSDLGAKAADFLEGVGLPASLLDSFLAQEGSQRTLSFLTIGASNVHAFFGMDGPYWTADLDGDREISWALPNGGTFVNDVTIGGDDYVAGASTDGVSLTDGSGALKTIDGGTTVKTVLVNIDGKQMTYGDIDNFGIVDIGETAEVNPDAVGLVIDNFDFGMAMMKPVSPLDFASYFALKATASQITLVGVEGVTVSAEKLLVELNQSSPSIYGLPLFPVVDFANTEAFASEELDLFDTNLDSDGNVVGDKDGILTLGDLAILNHVYSAGFSVLDGVGYDDNTRVDHEMLLGILNTNNEGKNLGVIDLAEAAALLGGDSAAFTAAGNADADHDGKIDPLGFEVNTGGTPVYLSMDSPLIRAEGRVELDVLGVVTLSGSIAFEMGPVENITLTDGSSKDVTTMTIGGADISAFVGIDGPYWTDLDGNSEVT